MRMEYRLVILVSLFAMLVFTGAACTRVEETSPETPEEASTDKEDSEVPEGKALIEARCTRCHDSARIYNHAKVDRQHWEKTVDTMIKKGAKLNEAERKAVVDFLVEQ